MPGRKMESGTTVWDAYDAGDFQSIEARCQQEVDDMLTIYKAMVDTRKNTDSSLKRLKRFDKFFDKHPELLRTQGVLSEAEVAETDA